MQPKIFVLDVDGVMTTGQFLYDSEGKSHKIFGPHDADGLKMLRGLVDIKFITADKRGLPITRKRIVQDMGYELDVVSEAERHGYLEKLGYENIAFMGDGYHDAKCMKHCMFAVAPNNARQEAKDAAHFVTPSNSAEGAVMDASLEILRRFFPDSGRL
jgi:3-deoxy-D-manno-octulosonate 8-phosphate phosphatase (KDO 8-P phosphatase)